MARMIRLSSLLLLVFLVYPLSAQEPVSLPDSLYLTWQEKDLSERIVKGMTSFVDLEIEDAIKDRTRNWQRDTSIPPELQELTVQNKRRALRLALGLVDKPLPAKLEFFSSGINFDGSIPNSKVAENELFEVYQVRWAVLDGFVAEGLYVTPKKRPEPLGSDELLKKTFAMVLIPDAGETPEDLMGITANLLPEQQLGVRWASAGFTLLIPTTINRESYQGKLSHREWLHREAYPMGRQVIGYEIQSALVAAEWLRFRGHKVSIGGYGEGGRTAFYAAACKPGFESVFVSGYFHKDSKPWLEPIDRSVWAELRDYGCAEIATLVYPTTIIVEQTQAKQAKETELEINRVGELRGELGTPRWILYSEEKFGARAGYPAVAALTNQIGFIDANLTRLPPITFLTDSRLQFDAKKRHLRMFNQLENVIKNLKVSAETSRNHLLQVAPKANKDALKTKLNEIKKELQNNVVGRCNHPLLDLECRSRQLYKTEQYTAWDVVLPFYHDCYSWGVLLLPSDITNGEKHPTIVLQTDGKNLPIDWADRDMNNQLQQTALDLVASGYITFLPNNLHQSQTSYQTLDRKCHSIGRSIGSLSIAAHEQLLNWLKTLPQVDPKQIVYYEIGHHQFSMRIPALVPGYQAIVCENGISDQSQLNFPVWNLTPRFQSAEIAALAFPRPLFIKQNQSDNPSETAKVAYQLSRAKWWYDQFDFEDQFKIQLLDQTDSRVPDFLHQSLKKPTQ